MISRYRDENSGSKTKSGRNGDSMESDILEYFETHKKIELKVIDIMTEIAKEMVEKLTNLPKEVKANDIIQIILMMRSVPKKVEKKFYISEMN